LPRYIFISILINKNKQTKTKSMKNFIIIAVTALFLTSCATATQEEVAVPTVDSTIVMIDTTAVDSISVPTTTVK
jgi:PBP1b-binding outer membrane lipoprotein LpoB